MRKIAIVFAALVLLASPVLAQDEMAVLNFIVIRDYSGKPIRNASGHYRCHPQRLMHLYEDASDRIEGNDVAVRTAGGEARALPAPDLRAIPDRGGDLALFVPNSTAVR